MNDLPKTNKPILCLDFDGVIHSYVSGWKGPRTIPDAPVNSALEFIEIALFDFKVHIFSSRSRYIFGRWAMKQWLIKQFENYFSIKHPDLATLEDPFTHDQLAVTSMAKDIVSSIKFPKRKPPAFLQIDDRAMTFTGTFPTIETIKSFKPWNKK